MTAFLKDGGSGFQTSVDIQGNIVAEACVGYPGRKDWQGAISIVNWDGDFPFTDGHANIAVQGNVIDQPHGIGIKVHCASHVTIEGNVLQSPRRSEAGRDFPAVFLDEVHGARVQRNLLVGPGWDASNSGLQKTAKCADISSDGSLFALPDPAPAK